MNEWMDGWMDGWMVGWMDGWLDGWMGSIHVSEKYQAEGGPFASRRHLPKIEISV